MIGPAHFATVTAHPLAITDTTTARRLGLRLVEYLQMLTTEIDDLDSEITERVNVLAPSVLATVGCGAPTTAKIIGETAQLRRFRSKDAFARVNGTAPLPVWSTNKQRQSPVTQRTSTTQRCTVRIAMT